MVHMMSARTEATDMHPRRHPFAVRALLGVAVALLTLMTTVGNGGASPAPGADNPWLQRRVAALAHAGGEDENPQETLYAFGRNIEAGVPILDMDVQLSADGIPVLMHDNTVDRTTNGTGPVNSLTAAQLGALDAAYWFSAACATCHDRPVDEYLYRGVRTGDVPPPPGFSADDFGVPTLQQVFERFPDAWFDIEIKDDAADVVDLAHAVADLIHSHGLSDRVVVASFGGPGIDAFRTAAPDVTTSATLDEVQSFFLSNTVPTNAQILDVPPTYKLGETVIDVVTPAFVERAHAAGLAVWVWMDSKSQQNAEFYTKLLDMGVDGLNVSRPSVLMQVLATRGDAWDPLAAPPTTPSTTAVPGTSGPTSTTPATDTLSARGTSPVAQPISAAPAYTG